jgi:hypothetical protein
MDSYGTYDAAEAQPATEVTLAQWARAEALKAILSGPMASQPSRLPGIADMVNVYAELIVTGGLPKPKPGTSY